MTRVIIGILVSYDMLSLVDKKGKSFVKFVIYEITKPK